MNPKHPSTNNKKPARLTALLLLSVIIVTHFIMGCGKDGPPLSQQIGILSVGSIVEIIEPGWNRSYKAGYYDSRGLYAGGTETIIILGHKGKLYAAVGYWEDSSNIYYGGYEYNSNWAQILRLDSPGGQWKVDLEMGPEYLRAEGLSSVTFTTDGNGNFLDEPINILVAGAWSYNLRMNDWTGTVTIFVRDDVSGIWTKKTVYTGPQSDYSCRTIRVYRDKVTGVDRIFFTVGVKGVWSGVYDPGVPGKIRWDDHSEIGDVASRPLAMIEANNCLLFSSGKLIYRRNDGASPSYTIVHDMSDLYPGNVIPAVG